MGRSGFQVLEKLVEKLWGAETNQVELAAKQNALKSAQESLVDIFGAKQGRQQLADVLLDWSGRSPSVPVAGFRGCCELINSALSSMIESEPPIFDEIVLCTLDSKGPRLCNYMSNAMLRDSTAGEHAEIPKGVEHMCFPVGLAATPVLPEQYCIVRTLDDGTRQYGFCAIVPPPPPAEGGPELEACEPGFVASLPGGKGFQCLCVFTRHTWFGLFRDLMATLAPAAAGASRDAAVDDPKSMPLSVIAVLEALLGSVDAAFPMPGERFTVEIPEQEPLHLTRANDESAPLIDVNFSALFDAVSVAGVLAIYRALMFEGHVVFVSSDMSKLSACSLAAVGLLYPFTWQHFFVPNLPVGMLDYVTAPMPFCLGIHASLLDTVLSLPIEESIVIVKIDSGEVAITGSGEVGGGGESMGELPGSLGGRLDKVWGKLHKDWRAGKTEPSVFNKEVLDEVVNAMVGMLCECREFVGDEGDDAFDTEALIESFNGEEDTQKFFRSLEATQHFDIWRQNCATLKAEGYPRRGLFETGISERNFVEGSGDGNIDVATARKLVDVSARLKSEGVAEKDTDGTAVGSVGHHEIWKNLTLWDSMFEDKLKTEATLEHLHIGGSSHLWDSMRSSGKADKLGELRSSSTTSPGTPAGYSGRSSGKLRNSMRRASAVALSVSAFQAGGDNMGKTKAELEVEASVEKAKKEALTKELKREAGQLSTKVVEYSETMMSFGMPLDHVST